MRAKGGLHDHPDQQEFKYRLRSYILGRNRGVLSNSANVEEDDTSDLVHTANSLTGTIVGKLDYDNAIECEEDCKEELEMSQLEVDGLENVAGYICHRLKNEFPTIPDKEGNNFTWVNHLSEGGLSKPSDELLQNLKECERIFQKINGDSLKITEHFLALHNEESAHIKCPLKVKTLFFRSRMFFKITRLNREIAERKFKRTRKMAKVC